MPLVAEQGLSACGSTCVDTQGDGANTSFGPSQQADSWSDQTATTLNQRIADGVFALNVTSPPADSTYQVRLNALGSLASTCQ